MANTVSDLDALNKFSNIHAKFAQYPGRAAFTDASELRPRLVRHHKGLVTGKVGEKPVPLFVDDADQKVAFREVDEDGHVTKWNCFSEDDMRQFLRHGTRGFLRGEVEPLRQIVDNDMLARPDPRCRFVFLLNDDRGKPLQISQACLQRLLSFHQVSPSFFDILEAYRGVWDDESELRFSAFRTLTVLDDPHPATVVRLLGRSGRRYQMSSNLKVPTSLPGLHGKFYKIRQLAIHHQFDIETGVQLWVMGDPHGLAKKRIQNYLPLGKKATSAFKDMRTSFRSSLDIHLEILSWILEEWSSYVKDLHDEIHETTEILILRDQNAFIEEFGQFAHPQKLPSMGELQAFAGQASTTLEIISSNDKIIGLLEHFYKNMLEKASFEEATTKHCEMSLGSFVVELTELRAQNEMHMDKIRELMTTVQFRFEIFSQRLQQKANRLQQKANRTMYFQAERSIKEAVIMRVITTITLIYLPPTFTSTLFSMETFKEVGVAVWATVCVPLLVITVILAYFVRQRSLPANKKLLVALENENGEPEDGGERNGPSSGLEDRPDKFMSRLWKSPTSRKGGDESDRARKDERGYWGLEKVRDFLGPWRRRGSSDNKDVEKVSSSPESNRTWPLK